MEQRAVVRHTIRASSGHAGKGRHAQSQRKRPEVTKGVVEAFVGVNAIIVSVGARPATYLHVVHMRTQMCQNKRIVHRMERFVPLVWMITGKRPRTASRNIRG